MKLGINIDHIAVLREARRINDPDPLHALSICSHAGADHITIHLREDRRHINDIDAAKIIKLSPLPVNMECANNEEIIDFACEHKPLRATLVPERREEITTEGGLDIISSRNSLKNTIKRLHDAEIEVSLFIDPNRKMVEAAKELGVDWIEFHTGRYANIFAMLYGGLRGTPYAIEELKLPREKLKNMLANELKKLRRLSYDSAELGLMVAAGHGLNYHNIKPVCEIETIEELNIGQSIIARSVFCGLEKAIRDMKDLISG